MFFVLSPAKNLNEERRAVVAPATLPRLLPQAEALMPTLRALAPHELAKLMHISDKLALLNAERFARWHTPFTEDNAKQAVFLFDGDVYEGLSAGTLPESAVAYLQAHLGILSGLYGIVRPLDWIQPYRLEMGTRLNNPRGKSLYDFWGSLIGEALAAMMEEAGDDVLVNLASNEYFQSIQKHLPKYRLITPVFKDAKNGQYKIISFYAKRARGLMVRYAAERGLQCVEDLQSFDSEGYRFDAALSNEHEWVFLREEHCK